MTTLRIRPPIDVSPPEWTIEWYGVMGDGVWLLLRNGNIHSTHTYKWQARLARRSASNQDDAPAKRTT